MERIEEEGLRERLRKPVVHQQKRSSDPRLWDNYQNPGPRSRVIWPQMLLDAQSIELRPLKFLHSHQNQSPHLRMELSLNINQTVFTYGTCILNNMNT